jgi:hypothetical protein
MEHTEVGAVHGGSKGKEGSRRGDEERRVKEMVITL